MPNLLQFDPSQFLGFFVIFTRMSGLMLSAPVLGDGNIPMLVRVLFTYVLSLLFFPVVAAPQVGPDPGLLPLTLLLMSELGVGLLMGFAARILFEGVQLAGEVIGFQMGLGIAHVVDPTSQLQIPLIGQVQSVFALFLFVVLDGHHMLIRALAGSYEVLGVGAVNWGEPALQFYSGLLGRLFFIGLQIGAPLTVALLAANFAMGLIARSVPQVNIFIVGFPFTIGLGLLFLALGFPFFIEALVMLIERIEGVIFTGLQVLR